MVDQDFRIILGITTLEPAGWGNIQGDNWRRESDLTLRQLLGSFEVWGNNALNGLYGSIPLPISDNRLGPTNKQSIEGNGKSQNKSNKGKGNGEDRGILHPTASPIRHQCKVNLSWMNPLRILSIQLSVLNNCPVKQGSDVKASQNNCCHSYLNANVGQHHARLQQRLFPWQSNWKCPAQTNFACSGRTIKKMSTPNLES